ncbi:hypothetical protein [Clostridium perfringens]|jgi:hypothetical protein
MNIVTNKDKKLLVNGLTENLIKFSDGELTHDLARKLAKISIDNIDFNDSALTHKGLTWYAKEIIDTIDFEALNKELIFA